MDYHDYVFDPKSGEFIGAFESMYRAAGVSGVDPWHQDDLSALPVLLLLEMTSRWPKSTVIDFACGKGAISSRLVNQGHEVIGLDISKSAIAEAKRRAPQGRFHVLDLSDIPSMERLLVSPPPSGYQVRSTVERPKALFSECLSYTPAWRELLALVVDRCEQVAVKLYLPPRPAGYVQNIREIERIFGSGITNQVSFSQGTGTTHLIEWTR